MFHGANGKFYFPEKEVGSAFLETYNHAQGDG